VSLFFLSTSLCLSTQFFVFRSFVIAGCPVLQFMQRYHLVSQNGGVVSTPTYKPPSPPPHLLLFLTLSNSTTLPPSLLFVCFVLFLPLFFPLFFLFPQTTHRVHQRSPNLRNNRTTTL